MLKQAARLLGVALLLIVATGIRPASAQGPGSLGADIYWLRAGTFLRLPIEVQGKQLAFTPPQEFVDMLNALA